MIRAQHPDPYEAVVTGAPPGLVGQITVEVYDPTDGGTLIAPTTAGITEPRPGTYRVLLTGSTIGTFSVRWVTPDGKVAEEDLIISADAPIDDEGVRPSLATMGSLMRARTKDFDGNELGTFTENTRPTDGQVQSAIDTALSLVGARLGNVPDRLEDLARSVVALRAAMIVETSYFPEETGAEDSAFASYRDQYREALTDYDAAIDRDVGDVQVKAASVGMKSATRLAAEAGGYVDP
jgi:hypothetical protein